MQCGGKGGVIRDQRPGLAGKRRVDVIEYCQGLWELDDKLRRGEPLTLLIGRDFLRQFRRNFSLFESLSQIISPARKIVGHRLFELREFFKKRRQLWRRQKGNHHLLDQPFLADRQHHVERVQR